MTDTTTKENNDRLWECRYCGEDIVGPAGTWNAHAFVALNRDRAPRSVIDVVCNEGDLNAAGHVTKHDPIGWP